jgi:hypothetical protein
MLITKCDKRGNRNIADGKENDGKIIEKKIQGANKEDSRINGE